jgi:hypothetical protein
MTPVSDMIKRTAKPVMAFLLLFSLCLELPANNNFKVQTAAPKGPSCKCCVPGPSDCPTPKCCAVPVPAQNPTQPLSVPARAQNESRVMAATTAVVLNFFTPQAVQTSSHLIAFTPLRSVPLFQRDCSYLI